MLRFRNFSLRCDKSNPKVSFETPWNWEIPQGKRIAIIANNSFLRYQLIAGISGLVPPMSGGIDVGGVIGWPVGGQGGLDSKLRVSHALGFLSSIYSDCLEKSRITLVEFWDLLSRVGIYPDLIIKGLSKDQKDFFYLALSVLFSFDYYLISHSRFLMSTAADPLRNLLLMQIEGKTLLATSSNRRFRREFCNEGLVLGPHGQVLFAGELPEATRWAERNLGAFDVSDSDEDQPDISQSFLNVEQPENDMDDFV